MRPDGRVTFLGHDARAPSSRATSCAACAPPSARRLRRRAHRHHLRLGFLVHERRFAPRAIWRYLRATEPYAADVTVFTVADRLATRGATPSRRSPPTSSSRASCSAGARARAAGAPRAAGARRRARARARRPPGPQLGALLAAARGGRYAGEIAPARTRSASRARC
jgi:hypothetical protein